jgi:hypothetical protein
MIARMLRSSIRKQNSTFFSFIRVPYISLWKKYSIIVVYFIFIFQEKIKRACTYEWKKMREKSSFFTVF